MAAGRPWGLIIIAMLAALLAALPLVAVMSSLFGPSGGLGHLAQTNLLLYLGNSLGLMLAVGLLTSVIGTGTAWLVASSDFAGKRLWSWLLVLPIAAPAYIIAYLYTDLLEFSGPVQSFIREAFGLRGAVLPTVRSLAGAALMLALVLYPYVYLLARASFSGQSRSQFLAARSLGLTPLAAFMRVALPGARPAIVGGLALVLMETLADYGVADYFAIPTFSTGIFRTWFALGDRLAAMQLSALMLSVVGLLVLLELLSRRGSVVTADRLSSGDALFQLSGRATVLANIACAVPVMLGFAVPMVLLISNVMVLPDRVLMDDGATTLLNTAGLAVTVAAVACGLAVLLTYAARQSDGARQGVSWLRMGIRLGTLGYALPGALIAVGLLASVGSLDLSVTRWARDTLSWSGGLILTGTAAILVYALVVRFLTVAFNAVSAGMAKISPSMDAAARSLGARPIGVVRRVHGPLLGPQLAVAACLVFVDVVRELPATLILRPFNFETLATRVYRLASDERIVEASTAALVIVALGLLPVIILNRKT